jgi:5-methylcytosine-specific restriction endonuclease McrA
MKTKKHQIRQTPEVQLHSCKNCKKSFKYASGLSNHKLSCKSQSTSELETIKEELKNIKASFEIERATYITKMQEKPQIKRKKINKELRNQIINKQQNKCGECKTALSSYFELDHIIGLQFGGTDEESNLSALCRECHGIKSITENQCRKQIQDAIKTILNEKRMS